MLQRLAIHNLAIIEKLEIEFEPGFIALTGETGAGKSIIIGALNLLLGERASSEDVRSGCDTAEVEALFRLPGNQPLQALLKSMELAQDGPLEELIIRREINPQGRGKCLVNGRMVTVGQLKEIGDLLADLHGQHQHQSLLQVEIHREILDAFGGQTLQKAWLAYRKNYQQYQDLTKRIRALMRDEREVERQKSILEFQTGEIAEAALEPGEDTALEDEKKRLEHAETLRLNALGAVDILYEGENQSPTVVDLISQCERMVEQAARLDTSLEANRALLTGALAQVQEAAEALRDYGADLSADPERLVEVEDRIHLVRQLKRKYGATIEEILAEHAGMEKELQSLTHSAEERQTLEKERHAIARNLTEAAEALSQERKKAGKTFARKLRAELSELEMPKVEFEVSLDREAASTDDASLIFPDGQTWRIHEYGVDLVEFRISPNAGEPPKPLRKIASGGELSRIMLALKVILSGSQSIPTLVFDEIDTGISGKTGAAIGEKMGRLGTQCQIICITHLAQIAARAEQHFAVEKAETGKRTLTQVRLLDLPARTEEIARLLGGDQASGIARKHAAELLNH